MDGYNQARWHVLQEFTIKLENHHENPIKEEIHEKKRKKEMEKFLKRLLDSYR